MTTKTIETKLQTADSIKALLTNVETPKHEAIANMAVERALIILYERQTADEQASHSTNHENGMGFSAFDAEILSSFACQINSKVGKHNDYLGRVAKLGECLSKKQMELARKRVVRYARQLAEVANAKVAPEPAKVAEIKAALASAQVAGEETDGEPVVERFEYTVKEALLDSFEALQGAREALALERKLKTTYYNGRKTVDIALERVEELERNHERLIREDTYGKVSSDPEHRTFRDANAKLKGWLAR